MGDHQGSRVAPFGRRLDHYPAGQVSSALLDRRDLGEAGIALDGDRAIGVPAIALDQRFDLFAGMPEYRRQRVHDDSQRVDRQRQHGYGVAGHVLGYDQAVAVVDGTARRGYRKRTDAVPLRLQRVGGVLEDLYPEELQPQPDNHQ